MSKTIDFKSRQKPYLTVTLPDDSVLMIGTPTKAIMDDLLLLKSSLDTVAEGENAEGAMDDLYNACARVMSRNKTGKVITSDYLADLFDFDDVIYFFNAYMDFVVEVADEKN